MKINLELILDSQYVKRMHTIPTIRDQSLSDHMHGCILLVMYFKDALELSDDELNTLIRFLAVHDLHEVEFGDIPYHTKKLNKIDDNNYVDKVLKHFGVDYLNDKLFKIAKFVDMLEFYYRMIREMQMGNTHHKVFEAFDRANKILETEYSELFNKIKTFEGTVERF